jgi:hypothetical protein
MFQGGQQHDSQELLLLLIDCLVDSLIYTASAGEKLRSAGDKIASDSNSVSASPSVPSSPCADIFAGSTCGATLNLIDFFAYQVFSCVNYDIVHGRHRNMRPMRQQKQHEGSVHCSELEPIWAAAAAATTTTAAQI